MPEDTQEQCKEIPGNFAHSHHPRHGIRGSEGITLGAVVLILMVKGGLLTYHVSN